MTLADIGFMGGERTIQFEDADGHDGVVLDGVSVSGYFQRGVSIERGDQAVTITGADFDSPSFPSFFTPSIWIASGQTGTIDIVGSTFVGAGVSVQSLGQMAGEIRDNVIETRHERHQDQRGSRRGDHRQRDRRLDRHRQRRGSDARRRRHVCRQHGVGLHGNGRRRMASASW